MILRVTDGVMEGNASLVRLTHSLHLDAGGELPRAVRRRLAEAALRGLHTVLRFPLPSLQIQYTALIRHGFSLATLRITASKEDIECRELGVKETDKRLKYSVIYGPGCY